MKKNIMTIIIMASVLVNLILTILIVFSIVPAMNKSNKMVESIASIINLEIGDKKEDESSNAIQDWVPLTLPYTAKQTVNLKKNPGGDGKSHYGMIETVIVSLNKNADDFDDVKNSIETSPIYILNEVLSLIGGYDYEKISSMTQDQIQNEALKKIKEIYKSEAIVSVSFEGFVYQ